MKFGKIFLLFFTLLLLSFSGCGNSHAADTENTAPPTDKTELDSLSFANDYNTTLLTGQHTQLTLYAHYSDHSVKKITENMLFQNSNPFIATVDNNGTVHALHEGNTTITASFQQKQIQTIIYVKSPPPQIVPVALILQAEKNSTTEGNTLQIQAFLNYSDQHREEITSNTNWESNDSAIATVSQTGLVTTLQAGTVSIKATYESFKTNYTLTVTAKKPTVSRIAYNCPSTPQSESIFADTYVTNNHEDINYSTDLISENLDIGQIEILFNTARNSDPTVSDTLTLPPQNIWDAMDSSAKTLYLVNSARCARGIRPFEGIDPILANDVTKPYAEFISVHENLFMTHPHTADGKSPEERMEDAGIILGQNSEYYGENITLVGAGLSNGYPEIYEPEVLAVYSWLYQDKKESYGHRHFVLKTGLQDNSGQSPQEGLIGAYTAKVNYEDNGIYWTKVFTVMDGFDPKISWDNNLSHAISVTLYKSVSP